MWAIHQTVEIKSIIHNSHYEAKKHFYFLQKIKAFSIRRKSVFAHESEKPERKIRWKLVGDDIFSINWFVNIITRRISLFGGGFVPEVSDARCWNVELQKILSQVWKQSCRGSWKGREKAGQPDSQKEEFLWRQKEKPLCKEREAVARWWRWGGGRGRSFNFIAREKIGADRWSLRSRAESG